MHRTKNSLSEAVRTKSIALLGRNLALSIDLSLQTKQAHWNVKGQNLVTGDNFCLVDGDRNKLGQNLFIFIG